MLQADAQTCHVRHHLLISRRQMTFRFTVRFMFAEAVLTSIVLIYMQMQINHWKETELLAIK